MSFSLVPLSVTSGAKLGGSRVTAGSSKVRTLPSVVCKALGESSQTVYQGAYGPWTVDPSDVKEVSLPPVFLIRRYMDTVSGQLDPLSPERVQSY